MSVYAVDGRCQRGHVLFQGVAQRRCKVCAEASRKRRRQECPEKYRVMESKWRRENPEASKAAKAKWAATPAGKACGRAKARRHAEKVGRDVLRERYRRSNAKKSRRKRYAEGIWHHYRLNLAGFDELLIASAGRCAICNRQFAQKKEPHVDHCHGSSAVRGLLCSSCNLGLGKFRDSPVVLSVAANYLRRSDERVRAA